MKIEGRFTLTLKTEGSLVRGWYCSDVPDRGLRLEVDGRGLFLPSEQGWVAPVSALLKGESLQFSAPPVYTVHGLISRVRVQPGRVIVVLEGTAEGDPNWMVHQIEDPKNKKVFVEWEVEETRVCSGRFGRFEGPGCVVEYVENTRKVRSKWLTYGRDGYPDGLTVAGQKAAEELGHRLFGDPECYLAIHVSRDHMERLPYWADQVDARLEAWAREGRMKEAERYGSRPKGAKDAKVVRPPRGQGGRVRVEWVIG